MNDYTDSVRLGLIWSDHIDLVMIEFPERPGALRKFLLGLHAGWNISLFHYRNHGAGTTYMRTVRFISNSYPDLGKVLAGIQVPPNEAGEFDSFLNKLGYPYVEETNNEVYRRYLRS